MISLLNSTIYQVYNLTLAPLIQGDWLGGIVVLLPYVLFFEIPWTLFIFTGIIKYKFSRAREEVRRPYFPEVSCIITCYNEERDIETVSYTHSEPTRPY